MKKINDLILMKMFWFFCLFLTPDKEQELSMEIRKKRFAETKNFPKCFSSIGLN